jgi:hypothetical protein
MLASFSQSGVVSQLIEAYAHCEFNNTNKPGWLELANNSFYLISSAVFQCKEYH